MLDVLFRMPPLESVAPVTEGQFKFNTRWFFNTARAFELGLGQVRSRSPHRFLCDTECCVFCASPQLGGRYEDTLRQLSWLRRQADVGAMPGMQVHIDHSLLSCPVCTAGVHWCLCPACSPTQQQYDFVFAKKVLDDCTLLAPSVLIPGLRFSVLVLDWCARVCAGALTPSTPFSPAAISGINTYTLVYFCSFHTSLKCRVSGTFYSCDSCMKGRVSYHACIGKHVCATVCYYRFGRGDTAALPLLHPPPRRPHPRRHALHRCRLYRVRVQVRGADAGCTCTRGGNRAAQSAAGLSAVAHTRPLATPPRVLWQREL